MKYRAFAYPPCLPAKLVRRSLDEDGPVRHSSIERRRIVFRHACPVKYIEDMERSEFNRGAGKSPITLIDMG